jgi:hypothetical protein
LLLANFKYLVAEQVIPAEFSVSQTISLHPTHFHHFDEVSFDVFLSRRFANSLSVLLQKNFI